MAKKLQIQKQARPMMTPQLRGVIKPITQKEKLTLERKAHQEGLTSGYYEAHELAQICDAVVQTERAYQHDRLENTIMPLVALWKGIEDLIATIDWVAATYRGQTLLAGLPAEGIGELSKLFGELTSLCDLLKMTDQPAYLDMKQRVQKRIEGLQAARKNDNGLRLREIAAADNQTDQRTIRAAAYRDLLSTARKPKGAGSITQVIGSRTVELLKAGRTYAQVAELLIGEWANAPRDSPQYQAYVEINNREGSSRRNYVRETHRNYLKSLEGGG